MSSVRKEARQRVTGSVEIIFNSLVKVVCSETCSNHTPRRWYTQHQPTYPHTNYEDMLQVRLQGIGTLPKSKNGENLGKDVSEFGKRPLI